VWNLWINFIRHYIESADPINAPPSICRISGADSMGHGGHVPPTIFTNGWAREHLELKNSKQETDQTVLTITIALTKTSNCAFRAKKWRGTTSPFASLTPISCNSEITLLSEYILAICFGDFFSARAQK